MKVSELFEYLRNLFLTACSGNLAENPEIQARCIWRDENNCVAKEVLREIGFSSGLKPVLTIEMGHESASADKLVEAWNSYPKAQLMEAYTGNALSCVPTPYFPADRRKVVEVRFLSGEMPYIYYETPASLAKLADSPQFAISASEELKSLRYYVRERVDELIEKRGAYGMTLAGKYEFEASGKVEDGLTYQRNPPYGEWTISQCLEILKEVDESEAEENRT